MLGQPGSKSILKVVIDVVGADVVLVLSSFVAVAVVCCCLLLFAVVGCCWCHRSKVKQIAVIKLLLLRPFGC